MIMEESSFRGGSGNPWAARPELGSAPAVQRDEDGRLEVFALTPEGVSSIWQVQPGGAWHDGWADHQGPPGGDSIRACRTGRNADGREHLFAVDDVGALWQSQQTAANNGWGTWGTLRAPGGVSLTGQFTTGVNQDGRSRRRSSSATTVRCGRSGRPRLAGAGATGASSDGQARRSVPVTGSAWAAMRTDARSCSSSVTTRPSGTCGRSPPTRAGVTWATLGQPRDTFDGTEPPKNRNLSSPFVLRNADGHLEVFSPGNGAFCNRWQERWRDGPGNVVWRHQGWNAKPAPGPDVALVWLNGALNAESRLEVVGLADDGAMWHAWQVDQPPFWSTWQSLHSPSTGIRTSEGLAIGKNSNGALSAFVVDQAGSVGHLQQAR